MMNKKIITHKLTIYLDCPGVIANLVTETNEPDLLIDQLTEAIHKFYKFRWWIRPATIRLNGSPTVVVPVSKILCFKVEPITDFKI